MDKTTNPVCKRLRQIYCCVGATFCRPNLEEAWKEIERLELELANLKEAFNDGSGGTR